VKLAILAIGVLLTGSTASIVALAAVAAVAAIVPGSKGVARRRLLPLAAAVAVATALAGGEFAGEYFEQRVSARLTGGLETVGRFEPKDAALVAFLADVPTAALTGRGAGGADFRLIDYTDSVFLSYGATITPAYLITRTLGDFGVVGLMLLVSLWVAWMASTETGSWQRMAALLVGVGSLLINAVSFGAALLVVGAIASVERRARRRAARAEAGAATARRGVQAPESQ
jgi:hypothetical protein